MIPSRQRLKLEYLLGNVSEAEEQINNYISVVCNHKHFLCLHLFHLLNNHGICLILLSFHGMSWHLMMTSLLISTGTGSLPVRTSLCCEISSLWKAMPSHIRSTSYTLFRETVSMNFCGDRRVGFRRVHILLAPLSRPCLVLSFVLSALYLKVYHW